jgi:predicted phage tail protein
LQLKLDDAGVEVTPTPEGFYIVEPTGEEEREMELRVNRARIGVGVSAVPLVLGAVIAGAAGAASVNRSFTPSDTSSGHAAVWVGTALVAVGGVSMIATGVLLGVRKRRLRRYEEEHGLQSRRIQWDSHTSRLVF